MRKSQDECRLDDKPTGLNTPWSDFVPGRCYQGFLRNSRDYSPKAAILELTFVSAAGGRTSVQALRASCVTIDHVCRLETVVGF